jgi:hypothetical protein
MLGLIGVPQAAEMDPEARCEAEVVAGGGVQFYCIHVGEVL